MTPNAIQSRTTDTTETDSALPPIGSLDGPRNLAGVGDRSVA